MTMPAHGYELFRRVQEAAAGTAYAVTETDRGFDVALDIVNAEWFGLFNRAGLSKTYIHHVAFPAPGAYSITDDARSVEWVAGSPRIGGSMERQVGRIKEVGTRKIYAFDDQGNFGKQVDYTFSSEEGRRLITGQAAQLGLEERRGAAEKIGLFFGLLAIGGLVVAGIVVLILWLAGAFG